MIVIMCVCVIEFLTDVGKCGCFVRTRNMDGLYKPFSHHCLWKFLLACHMFALAPGVVFASCPKVSWPVSLPF